MREQNHSILKPVATMPTWMKSQNTIVYSLNNKNIILGDVAASYNTYEEDTHITRLNGYRSVFITAAQKPGENITKTQQLYLPVIENFKAKLPANIDLVHHFDQADNVNKRLSGLGIDFVIAILLVAITLLPLGQRAAIIVMISIPLSLAIGIVLMNALGIQPESIKYCWPGGCTWVCWWMTVLWLLKILNAGCVMGIHALKQL